MTTSKQYADIFRAELVTSATIDGLSIAVYTNDLLHVKVPEYFTIDIPVFEKSKAYLKTIAPNRSYHFIFEFEKYSEVDPEMRKRRASRDGTEFALTDAVVISNLPQKMLGDFYLRINKPIRPTKFFYALDKAVEWSLKKKEEMTKPNS